MKFDNIDELCVNTLRTLSIDMVGKADSGHPGLPLGAAPLAYAVWAGHLKFSPADPLWADRDRFVLSAGHGSSLLYSMLHVYGFGLEMEELRNFRQLGSRTPGHPEYGHTPGPAGPGHRQRRRLRHRRTHPGGACLLYTSPSPRDRG